MSWALSAKSALVAEDPAPRPAAVASNRTTFDAMSAGASTIEAVMGRAGLPQLQGIEQRHSSGSGVGQVAGDQHQAVHQRRRGDQTTT